MLEATNAADPAHISPDGDEIFTSGKVSPINQSNAGHEP